MTMFSYVRYGPVSGCSTLQDITRDHPDFQAVRRQPETEAHIRPLFRVVSRARPRHVVAIQTTADMIDHIKWVNKAAQAMIRYDMMDDSQLSVVSFNNVSKVEHGMVGLTGEAVRETVADTIPGKYQLAGHNMTCLSCMLEHVVESVLGNQTEEVNIVIVVKLGQDIGNLEDIGGIVGSARISFLSLSSEIPSLAEIAEFDDVATMTGGENFLVGWSHHHMDLYYEIVRSLHTALEGDKVARTIHTHHHLGPERATQGTFYSDGGSVVFRVFVPDTEDHMIKSVTFQNSETGKKFGPYTKMSASYDLINFKTPNIVGQLPWEDQGDRKHWNYTVEWFEGKETTKSIIDVSSPLSPDHMEVESWISAIESWSCPQDFRHVKVWASLNMPVVSGVLVRARVEILQENGTTTSLPPLELTDSQEDSQDLLSGVLLDYPGPGRYQITVMVEDLITGQTREASPRHVVRLSQVPRTDCVPPGQVRDLSVAIHNNSDVITAYWTNTWGQVASYRIITSTEVCNIMQQGDGVETLLSVQTMSRPGELEEQVVQFTKYDQLYYVGVVAVDAAGNVGSVSNIVTVFVPRPVVESDDLSSPVSLNQSSSLLDNYQSIIIISSSLGGVLMVCLLCIVYIVISGRYRGRAKSLDRTASPDYQVENQNNQGVTDVQQILARERQSQAALQAGTASLPVYWSCDQILTRNCHNYYNCQAELGQGESSPQSRYSHSSDSYTDSHSGLTSAATDTESYRLSSPYSGQTVSTTNDITDEGYDSASRELELINSRKLYTIV